jgi:ATP synthase protein I
MVNFSGDPHKRGASKGSSSQDAQLDQLAKRLKRAQADQAATRPDQREPDTAMGRGLQMGVELVAGVLAGALLGWLVDRWFGLSPWGIIIGFMLGTAAGFLNVYRRSFGAGSDTES